VLYLEKKYAAAEFPLKRALERDEANYGKVHLTVSSSLNNLAEVYRIQGKNAMAEPLYRRALLIDEKLLGPGHVDVGTDLNNLGALYLFQRRYAEAEPILHRALAIRESTLERRHPELAMALDNLASLYRFMGRFEEAEELDVNSGIHGNWTLDNAKQQLHQYLQQNKITADYKYSAVGPDHNRYDWKIIRQSKSTIFTPANLCTASRESASDIRCCTVPMSTEFS